MNGLRSISLLLLSIVSFKATAQHSPVRVAVLLPFHAEKGANDAFNQAMLDYWLGIQTAAEDLGTNGIPCEIDLRDFKNDSLFFCSVAGKLWLNNHDLILGPVYPKQLKSMDQDYTITKPWVAPLAPYAFQSASNGISMFASDSVRLLGLASEIQRCYPRHKIAIISPDKPKNAAQSQKTEAQLLRLLEGSSVSKHIWKTSSKSLSPALSTGSDSFLFVYTDQFTPEAQSYLSKRALDATNSYAIGQFDWLDAQAAVSLPVDQKNRMLYPGNVVLDFLDSTVSYLAQRMTVSQWGEPSKYAYLGYDHLLFLVSHFSVSPSLQPLYFRQQQLSPTFQGSIQNIRLTPTGHGMANAGIRLVRIEGEYQIPVNP
ncbi:MAG: hypothetical protein ACO3DK_04655 [Bacteroidia bacterium]